MPSGWRGVQRGHRAGDTPLGSGEGGGNCEVRDCVGEGAGGYFRAWAGGGAMWVYECVTGLWDCMWWAKWAEECLVQLTLLVSFRECMALGSSCLDLGWGQAP